METKQITCISCPIGCLLTVTLNGGEVAEVKGNQCNRGVAHAKMECVAPTRMMTSTVRVVGAVLGAAPVKTAHPVPKDKVAACACALKNIQLEAPVAMGQVVLPDVCGTGVDIVATRTIPDAKEN